MTHEHDAMCWSSYEPCGEHHQHTYNCGNGRLRPACPDYERETALLKTAAQKLRAAALALAAGMQVEPVGSTDRAFKALDLALQQAARDYAIAWKVSRDRIADEDADARPGARSRRR